MSMGMAASFRYEKPHADRCACLTPTVALVLPELYGSQRRFFRSVGLRFGTGVPAGENGRFTFYRKVADFLSAYALTFRGTHAAATRTVKAVMMSYGMVASF